MTSLFPHSPYAEDQPYARSILYLHTFRAGAMMGTFISFLTAPASLLPARRSLPVRNPNPLSRPPFTVQLLPRLLIHSSRGLIVGGIFGVAATFGRMYGRKEIEWQDRSWRLLENKGEEDTDLVSFGGTAVGAVVGVLAVRRGVNIGMGKAVLGGAGLGMAAGVPYMMVTFARGRKPA
ncbi:hypothetical protein P280DRAFT_511460 [Massarina eburnea CBS 473.64]|uniref:Uncharacterized protein n=1 Tax=Massarina eburnea CBS 473.64 TaxID=1395130 RepID=A0A6A6RIX5_9PLEO|nr:hypothetical protein P280DRAFT_511460 [Massarina eburnea CBS 473.64]